MEDSSKSPNAPSPHVPFATAFWYWLKLGFISFGGPAGQIAIMHSELVEKKRWISEKRFLHALNYCMVLPGPEAQQLATYIGWLLHGTWGGIVAGALFVLPSLFILMGLSWAYMAWGEVEAIKGIFQGVKPAVVAVVAFAVLRVGSRAVKNWATLALAAAAFVALLLHAPFPLIVLAAGVFGYAGSKVWPDLFKLGGGHGKKSADSAKSATEPVPFVIDDHHEILHHTRPSAAQFTRHLAVGLALWALPVAALFAWQGWHGTHTQMAWFFTQAALVTFGGAYAVLPFVADRAANSYHWLSRLQMVDGLALGETTPGPLIMVTAFVGFVGGWQQYAQSPLALHWTSAVLGCLVATYFTFLPSFVFILLGAPIIEQMRGELRLTAALSGITAAVVGVILHLAVTFGRDVFLAHVYEWDWQSLADGVDWFAVLLASISFIALWRLKVDIVRVVLICGLAGLALTWFTP